MTDEGGAPLTLPRTRPVRQGTPTLAARPAWGVVVTDDLRTL